MAAFSVVLDMPPSVNAMYANRRQKPGAKSKPGRVKTPTYRRWGDAAIKSIWWQVKPTERIGGKFAVIILLPEKTRLDIDNAIKPILDALVASGRIDDDRNVIDLSVGKVRVESTVLVRVTGVA